MKTSSRLSFLGACAKTPFEGVLLLLTIFLASHTSAQTVADNPTDVPRTISYQALVNDAFGEPLIDGDYTIGAALYPASADRTLWRDTFRVHVVRGVVNVLLGSGAVPLPDLGAAGSLWLGIRINGGEELPLAQFTAAPYALTVPNGAITKDKIANGAITSEKMGTDFVGSVSLNGQKLNGKGESVNIVTGDGISATVDPGTNTILIKGNGGVSTPAGGKGAEAQANSTITGNLTVVQNTFFNTGLDGLGHTTSTTIGGSIKTQLAAGVVKSTGAGTALTTGQVSLKSDVTDLLPVANGGTGLTTYNKGDILYALNNSTLQRLTAPLGPGSWLMIGKRQVPDWFGVGTGQILYGNYLNEWDRLPPGTEGQVLTMMNQSGSVIPNWEDDKPKAENISGVLAVANGGTGLANYSPGDMLYASDAKSFATLHTTDYEDGRLLALNSGIPQWEAGGGRDGQVLSMFHGHPYWAPLIPWTDPPGTPPGMEGQVLTLKKDGGGTLGPIWADASGAPSSGLLSVAKGGTGITSYTKGDMLYASADPVTGAVSLAKLPARWLDPDHLDRTFLMGMTNGVPKWASLGKGGILTATDDSVLGVLPAPKDNASHLLEINSGVPAWTFPTLKGDILCAGADNILSYLSVGAHPDGQVLTLSGGVPQWAAASGGTGGGSQSLFKQKQHNTTYSSTASCDYASGHYVGLTTTNTPAHDDELSLPLQQGVMYLVYFGTTTAGWVGDVVYHSGSYILSSTANFSLGGSNIRLLAQTNQGSAGDGQGDITPGFYFTNGPTLVQTTGSNPQIWISVSTTSNWCNVSNSGTFLQGAWLLAVPLNLK